MEITYEKKLKKIILNDLKLKKILGPYYNIFYLRISELQSASNMHEYLTYSNGNPHLLVGTLKGHYGIHLNVNYRVIIKPETDNYSSNGLIKCNKVILKGVVDYHGQKYTWKIP